MAHTAQSWQELIPDVFCPHIAVMCTRDAEATCQKNNLSFVEMMRPFCQLTTEAHVRDAHNQPHVVKNLRLRFSEPNSDVPSMGATKQTMHNTVLKAQPSATIVPGSTLQVGNLTLNVLTPWFEAYRQQYIQLLRVSDHEYLRHYVACLYVVSTSHSRPMDAFIDLQKKQQDMAKEQTYPKWLTPYVFNYFLLLHDVSRGEEDHAQSIFQSMKATFSPQSVHLLKINSRSPDASVPGGMPDPWGQYLSKPDNSPLDEDADGFGSPKMNHSTRVASQSGASSHASLPVIPQPTLSEIATDALRGEPVSTSSDPLSQALTDQLQSSELGAGEAPLEPEQSGMTPKRAASVAASSSSDVLHGHFLTVSDHDRLRIFINEMAVRGLIPHIERSIRALTDQVNSKKGLQRTLYSATRKWFGSTNKPVIMQGQSYTSDAAELQSRKLADLAFLVQLYDTAYNWYHTAKRDFHNDNAMLHFAGAVELAAVSLFMQGAYRRDPQSYFEEAVNTYETACKSHQFALRSTLLFFEFLKFRGLYKEAATALIRMTSDETDLAAALLTEQAAICYLRLPSPMVRKYAMHMLLAGHRFKKAFQRQHALRAYTLALQVYQTKGWWVAEDHMNFIVGRLAMDLHELTLGHDSFHQLLSHRSRLVAASQQLLYLQEFLLAVKRFLIKSDKKAMEESQNSLSSCVDVANLLPLARFPRIDAQLTRVILPGVADSTKLMTTADVDPSENDDAMPAAEGHAADDEEGKREELWLCMEELGARFTVAASDSSARNGYLGATPAGFVWDVRLFGPHTENSQHPRCALGERVMVEIVLSNDLQIPLTLTNISLMWRLFPVSLADTTDKADTKPEIEGSESVECNSIPMITLEPQARQPVCLSLTPQQEGKLHVVGIVYTIVESAPPREGGRARSGTQRLSLASGLRFRQEIEPKGPRLNQTKDHRCSVMYGPDRRLQLAVYPPMPLLRMQFDAMPTALLCGEVHHCIVKLTNVGRVALRRLRAVCPENQQIVWGAVKKRVAARNGIYSTVGQSTPANGSSTSQSCELRDKVWPCFPLASSSAFTGSSPLVGEDLRARVCDIDLPGERLEPGGSVEVDCWIRGSALPGLQSIDTLMYFDVAGETAFTHRVLRHTNQINVGESIRIAGRARQSVATQTAGRDRNPLLVSVDVENLSQGDASESPKFNIKQIVGVSSQFGLTSLQEDEAVELLSRETAYVHLKASHVPIGKGLVEVTDIPYSSGEMIDSLAMPCLELFGQDNVAQPFAASEPDRKDPASTALGSRATSSPMQTQSTVSLHPALAPCVSTPIGIIVLWEATVRSSSGDSRTAYGQHHMLLESLETPVSSVTAQSALTSSYSASLRAGMEGAGDSATAVPDELLVKASIKHTDKLLHDFSKKRLCIVAVELNLHNCHDTDVEVEVLPQTNAGGAEAQSTKTKSTGSVAFSWVGCTHCKLRVGPSADRSVRLTACFSRPAIYNLSSLRMRVTKLAGMASESCEQRALAPSLLMLEDKLGESGGK